MLFLAGSVILIAALTTMPPRIVHLNHAGASPSPQSVADLVISHIQKEQTLGGYAAAGEAPLKNVYERAGKLIGANPDEIALVESATVAWTRLFYAFANHQKKRKVILVSEAEYAANLVAACRYAQTHEWSVLVIPSALDADGMSTGKIDMDVFHSMLKGNYMHQNTLLDPQSIAIVCITHVPTNSGIVNPIEKMGVEIEKYNRDRVHDDRVFFLVDTCQSVGQLTIKVADIHCDGLVATGRKYLRGPRGTGFLFVKQALLDNLWPDHCDHFGVPVLEIPNRSQLDSPLEKILKFAPRHDARRFEFWESNIANRLGLGEALSVALDLGETGITRPIVDDLMPFMYDALKNMKGLELHYPPECGILTFSIPLISSEEVKERLWNHETARFEVSVVPATSTPLDSSRSGVGNLVRASIHYTTTKDEIELFCRAIAGMTSSA